MQSRETSLWTFEVLSINVRKKKQKGGFSRRTLLVYQDTVVKPVEERIAMVHRIEV
jgi:hypothetical protein